ncbi:MAG: glycosyltransferase family 1 protein [Chloroflexi bacterium]|nr:MAG: glycosyltransferase family 1 protein [Chloroflexota bacterium]
MKEGQYILDARTATAHFPGIGRYVRNLAAALPPLLTDDERLVILWNPSDPTAWNPTSLASQQVQIVPAPVSSFSLRQQWTIPRLLRQFAQSPVPSSQSLIPTPPSPLFHSTYYLMPYCPGTPTLLTVYDLIALLHPQTVSLRARLFFRVATRLALAASDRIVTISASARDDLLAHFPVDPSRVTSIPLAADPRFRPQPADEIARVRAKYHLPDRYIFYLGINKPHKNLPRLIDAYAQLHNSQFTIHNSQLIIAGAWDDRYPESRALAAPLGDAVRFLGPVDDADLPALHSAATLFAFPSLYEGFGLPVLEAMACGAPVVCGNRSSLPEVAGKAALLVDPTDTGAIAAALRLVLEDDNLRRSMAEKSLAQAATFSWQRTAAETLAVYREMATSVR